MDGFKKGAIVTGSESGIGRAIAVALAADGFDVGVTWYREKSAGELTAEKVRALGRRAVLHQLDVRDSEAGARLIAEMAPELGGLGAFVNNAGVPQHTSFLDLDVPTWSDVLGVNLTAAFTLSQAAARLMVEQGRGGRIVNVTSVHEHLPHRASAAYATSKGGLGLLTKSMAVELAQHGINVNAVAPGEIATAMTESDGIDSRTLPRPAIPLGRPGDPREVAAVVAFLCGANSSYVTGASYLVDGGISLMGVVSNQV
jgi:NAD(P)-dependent dehydrogenase (short-subunit alcohol dehydrogenase family)